MTFTAPCVMWSHEPSDRKYSDWHASRTPQSFFQGGFFVYNTNTSTKSTNTGEKDQATNTDDSGYSGRARYSSGNYTGNSTTATYIKTTPNGYAWDARGLGDTEAWKESSNYEVVETLRNNWIHVASVMLCCPLVFALHVVFVLN